jgi:hypothetical protein
MAVVFTLRKDAQRVAIEGNWVIDVHRSLTLVVTRPLAAMAPCAPRSWGCSGTKAGICRASLRRERTARFFIVPDIEQRLPASTRRWLKRFVAGINWYLDHTPELPIEFRLFALDKEYWSVKDVLRLARLVSADFSWIYYAPAARHVKKGRPGQIQAHFAAFADATASKHAIFPRLQAL